MINIYDNVQQASDFVQKAVAPYCPQIGVVLGSGLGSFADSLASSVAIPYSEIPGFGASQVSGHAGRLVAGLCHQVPILVMQGRIHCYEGFPLSQVVLPVRTLVASGCKILLITNAAGGINPSLVPGDFALIRDHINLSGQNPLAGAHDDRLGPRFPDMSNAYDADLRQLAHQAAAQEGITLKEGVYSWLLGPSYETPAEIKMLHKLGCDLAGMSTVPEVIAAHHMGARIIGISCVTNLAAGLGGKLTHEEVKQTAQRVEPIFIRLLTRIITLAGVRE